MKTLLAAALIGGLVAVAPGAQAQDRRPCVSKVEFQSMNGAMLHSRTKFTRHQVETRWEVVGEGALDHDVSDNRLHLIVYRACGYPESRASVWAFYVVGSHKLTGVYRNASRMTPHGRP